MNLFLRPRRLAIVTALTAMWCLLWGEFTIANIVSGLAVAILISISGIDTPARGGVRIVPLVRLLWLVAIDLAKSTIDVAFEILTPTDHTKESVVAARLPVDSRKHFLLLIVAITLTPGTAVVDGDTETGYLYLHLLHTRRREATLAHVEQLADLACRALPVPDEGDGADEANGGQSSQPSEPTERPA